VPGAEVLPGGPEARRSLACCEELLKPIDFAEEALDPEAMNTFLLVSNVVLWLAVLFLGFLLLGTLRSLGLLRWHLEQLEATTPNRLNRNGLKPGKKAPDFTLPGVAGPEVALHDFAGRKVLLVFTQTGCAPCHQIMPELDRLQRGGEIQVLVVNNGEMEATRKWIGEVQAHFPVLVQEHFSLSKRYEVFATPFGFLIDENGVIASKGIINNGQHVDLVLSGARDGVKHGRVEEEPAGAAAGGV
jgi:methylamine dehydrogenase accessory protein MauD